METNILPELFVQRVHKINSSLDESSFAGERKIAIRTNTLKTSAIDLIRALKEQGVEIQEVSWYKDAFIVLNKTSRELTEIPVYKKRLFYIQSLSSILVSLILDPQPNEKILDLTAAPGSKTSHIAALMQNTGEIIANDISRDRVFKLKTNLVDLGVTNTKVINMLGEKVWSKYPEYFDRVLLDAPCSMEGRINSTDPSTYADWSMKKIKRLSKQQKWLLRSAVSAAKVGGTIVYSTCTLAPEENEEVIDWILDKEKGKVELDEINYEGVPLINGLSEWERKVYDKNILRTKRIMPNETMEGFFIARFKKIKSNI
jgi:16S rRNA (cytosine1407-C5)-methyltransferase